jgi:hypothetical protein
MSSPHHITVTSFRSPSISFVPSPPSASQDNRCVSDGPSSLTLGSLVDTRKLVCNLLPYSLLSQPYRLHRQNPSANRPHSVLVLCPQATNGNRPFGCLVPCSKSVSGLRPTNAAEIALQELERYRAPLVATHLGSANVDVALPGHLQARKKARTLVFLKRDRRDDKACHGHASKIWTLSM